MRAFCGVSVLLFGLLVLATVSAAAYNRVGEIAVSISADTQQGRDCSDAIQWVAPAPTLSTSMTVEVINIQVATYGCEQFVENPVWFELTDLIVGERYQVDSCNSGTTLQTALIVYDGSCSSLLCISADDSSTNCYPYYQSSVRFTALSTSAYIAAGGRSPDTGTLVLTVSSLQGEECEDSILISSPTILRPVEQTIDITDTGYVVSACNRVAYNPVWLALDDLIEGMEYTVSTCTGNATLSETVVIVYSGSCSELYCVDANETDCRFAFSLLTSASFTANSSSALVAVGAYYVGDTGSVVVTVSNDFHPIEGDYCFSAYSLSAPVTSFTSQISVPISSNGRSRSCNQTAYNPVWIALEDAVPGVEYTVTTCNEDTTVSDTIIIVYEGSCSSLACQIDNDDSDCGYYSYSSTVTFEAQTETVYFLVGTYDPNVSSGTAVVSVTINEPEGAVCDTAIDIVAPTLYSPKKKITLELVDTLYGTNGCSKSAFYANWVHLKDLEIGQNYTVDTCDWKGPSTVADTVLLVYSGDCSELECIAGSDDDPNCWSSTLSSLSFIAETSWVYIAVGAWDLTYTSGTIGLNIRLSYPSDEDGYDCFDSIEVSAPALSSSVVIPVYVPMDGITAYGCLQNAYNSVWVKVVGLVRGHNYTLTTCHEGNTLDDTIVIVYTGPCSQLSCYDASNFDDYDCAYNFYDTMTFTADTQFINIAVGANSYVEHGYVDVTLTSGKPEQ